MTVTRRMNTTNKDVDGGQRGSGRNIGESRQVPLHSVSVHGSRGKARSANEDCMMLPPAVEYDKACAIFKDLFGRSHDVARSLLDGLLEGLNMNGVDADVLSCLAIRMESYMIALEQMGYTADLNSLSTLEQIV
ncbi:unnamed protein product [Echinostoma caproni]|uniref:Pentatricopeptide repeat-containing protein n=1 Tax=Echinostoma caproni TaxID=27848 RepID=A0A183B898_9TREM|nr:unnamed protein product [Echinostoma caproni]